MNTTFGVMYSILSIHFICVNYIPAAGVSVQMPCRDTYHSMLHVKSVSF